MTQNPYLQPPPPLPPVEPTKKKHTARNWLIGSAVVVVGVVTIAVSTSRQPTASKVNTEPAAVAPVTTPAPTTTTAPTVALPTVYGMTFEKAMAALEVAGFTQPPHPVDSSGMPVDQPEGYTVTNIVDNTNSASAAQPDDDITLVLKLTSPCKYDKTISSSSENCTNPNDTIVYKVTGGSASDITYVSDESGSIEQATGGVSLPWTKTITVPSGSMDFKSVSAQNAAGGSITCSITVNGDVVSKHTSTGDYAIADCTP